MSISGDYNLIFRRIWSYFGLFNAGKYSEKIIQARKKERFVSDLCRFVSERHTICFIISPPRRSGWRNGSWCRNSTNKKKGHRLSPTSFFHIKESLYSLTSSASAGAWALGAVFLLLLRVVLVLVDFLSTLSRFSLKSTSSIMAISEASPRRVSGIRMILV